MTEVKLGPNVAQPTRERYGVVFHIDSDSEAIQKKTLNNIRNVLNDTRLTGRLTVELVANSHGHTVYKKGNPWEEQLRELLAKGVILSQCSNTLKELNVDPASLYEFIQFIPSGMGQIILREGEGWAYVHPTV